MATLSTAPNANNGEVISLQTEKQHARSNFRRGVARLFRHRMAVIGALMLIGIFLYVTIGSMIYTEVQSNYNDTTRTLEEPSADHAFGTDAIGRDIFIRTIYGGQISLFIGVTAVIVEISVGTMVGILAGYFGGVIDSILMRLVEAMLSVPQLFVLLIASRVFANKLPDFTIAGREFSSTMIIIIGAIGLTSWMSISRIVRAAVLAIKEQEYIVAARSIGANNRRIIFQHILPNVVAPIIVAATLGVASAILLESYLGFLGLGVRAPTATWGNMLDDAFDHLNLWFVWFFPALFVVFTVLGINFFGDGLRDAFDPRSTR